MKRLLSLQHDPPGLREFRTDRSVDHTWESFGDYRRGVAKRELAASLVAAQRGLCCYCEIKLIPDDYQIDHVIPRSDPMQGAELALDSTNLVASCKGGTNRNFADDAARDPSRFLPPITTTMSCGQKKGAARLLDPRTIPTAPPIFVVTMDGRIGVDETACASGGITVAEAFKARDGLGLNSPRLIIYRRKLRDELAMYPVEPAILLAAARQELLPDESGHLKPWFSTARSFFRSLAEVILLEEPQEWIGNDISLPQGHQ